jgi:transcriptional regulator with XRE-family HTH domain
VKFSDWLIDQLEAQQWSYRQLAQQAGITRSAISRVITGQNDPGPDFCNGIARALGIPPVEVFYRAGLLDPPPDTNPPIDKFLDLVEQLSEDDFERLLIFAEGLYKRQK